MNNDKIMNNDKSSLELPIIPIKSIRKIRNQQTKEKVSRPSPLNHDYIHYSDIQIR